MGDAWEYDDEYAARIEYIEPLSSADIDEDYLRPEFIPPLDYDDDDSWGSTPSHSTGSRFMRKMNEIKYRPIPTGQFSSRTVFPFLIDGSDAKQSASDVQLICKLQEKTFNCHRVILMQQSSTFHTMFTGNFAEANKGPVIIEDITGEKMLEILRFIYCGFVETDVTNASPEVQHEFLYAAVKYDLKELVDFLLIALKEKLTGGLACCYLLWADRFGLEELKISCFNEMAKRASSDAVIGSEEWQEVLAHKQLMTEYYRFSARN